MKADIFPIKSLSFESGSKRLEPGEKNSGFHTLLKYSKMFLPLESLKDIYTSVNDQNFRYCCSVLEVCGLFEI